MITTRKAYAENDKLLATLNEVNERVIKDPSKTYLVWEGNRFPNNLTAGFKAPAGCVIDWGDGNVETFKDASTQVNTHTYTDSIKYHLISLSDYTLVNGYAFSTCSGLTSIVIGNGVTSIGIHAFSTCSGLTSIVIGNGVTSIGDKAFYDCSGLTSIVIGNGVTSIGSYAFYACSGLTSVTIPDSVTSIGSYAFCGCSGLISVMIGNGVINIGKYAFYGCSGLTSVTIPDSVTSIGNGAFSGCSGLTSVTIPDSVTSIRGYAFYGCSGLTSVTIPDSVKSMGDRVFYGCSGLKTIKILATEPPTIVSSVFAGTSIEKIIVPKSAIDTYKSAAIWLTYADKIVYEIDSSEYENTFWLSGGKQLKGSIDLNNLTTIGNYYALGIDGISNIPLGTSGPFTLKVSSVPEGSNFLIQQRFTQCNNENTYTRVRKTDGNWESIGSALGSYGSGWSVTHNTNTAAIINFTRAEAIKSGCTESGDGTHKIMVPVKALIRCAMNHYSTRACLRVGGVSGTLETNPSYFGIQIEGLPVMDDFLVHIDIKSYSSDAWITLEHATKTYQCFYNSNYYVKTINGQPNPYYDARPIWVYVPRAGNRAGAITGGAIPEVPDGKIGSASQPVYLTDGVLTPCTYAIEVRGDLPDTPAANTLYFITDEC